jgi:hypothetical protein
MVSLEREDDPDVPHGKILLWWKSNLPEDL